MSKNKKFNPFKNLVLDDYEKEIKRSFAQGKLVSVPKKEFEETKGMFEEAAKNYLAYP